MRRVTTALVLAAVALAGAAAPAAAQDNHAIAVNKKDDSSLFKLAFSIKKVGSEVVEAENAAVAYGSCERCETVAIAIQVLILTSDDLETVTPTNLAIALNEECPSCTTVALAYQIVIGRGEDLELTKEGRRQIRRIERELRRLRKSGLDPLELAERVDGLVDELREVLRTQLVPRRDRDRDDDRDEDEDLEQPEEDESERDLGGEPPPEQEEPPPETTTPVEPAPAPEPEPAPAPAPEDGTSTTP